ncbi:unnamed protein product [Pleuronectes platessa]|uniref:Sickle tail protein homolog n=1 Tax=Pleuronectes platessa TaxID=8262 RepID=A0A9N7TT98_PLEPL|nr:unnamed protein product [Pleuronectes platessa]
MEEEIADEDKDRSHEEEQNKSNLKVTSPEDAERVGRRQASPNGTPPLRADARGSRTVPRRHTLGGARGSREILAMQPPDMDKKREAFLEHLKQKYPHHASAIMGHQERLREQETRGRGKPAFVAKTIEVMVRLAPSHRGAPGDTDILLHPPSPERSGAALCVAVNASGSVRGSFLFQPSPK